MTFQDRQASLEFKFSQRFRELEAKRVEQSKPKEHEAVDFARVYCPVYDKIRPSWLCESEHGDFHEVPDEDWSRDE